MHVTSPVVPRTEMQVAGNRPVARIQADPGEIQNGRLPGIHPHFNCNISDSEKTMIRESPARRVLGDKSANASVRVQQESPHCPLKKTHLVVDVAAQSPRRMLPEMFSPRAGQKRRIDELEDVHPAPDSARVPATAELGQGSRGPSQDSMEDLSVSFASTDVLSDASDGDVERQQHEPHRSSSTTVLSSLHLSQEGPAPLEDQFELNEDIPVSQSQNLSQYPSDKHNMVSSTPRVSRNTGSARPLWDHLCRQAI